MPNRKWASQPEEYCRSGSGCGRGSGIAKLFHWGPVEPWKKEENPKSDDKEMWQEFVDDTIGWGEFFQQYEKRKWK